MQVTLQPNSQRQVNNVAVSEFIENTHLQMKERNHLEITKRDHGFILCIANYAKFMLSLKKYVYMLDSFMGRVKLSVSFALVYFQCGAYLNKKIYITRSWVTRVAVSYIA